METAVRDVLVVGAGLSGLMAARALQERGLHVTLVDKGRSVGGRLATRRIGPGRADHGAQFFTVRAPEFQAQVDAWASAGLVYRWSTGWAQGSLDTTPPDGHPRYAVRDGMNALAKHLAGGLDVRVKTRLVRIRAADATWLAEDEQGQPYAARALLLTPPVPQSLALLDAGSVHLESADRAVLGEIEYAPCLAGLFWVEGEINLPPPGAVQAPDPDIGWIADNRRKGISHEATIITVHATPERSRQLLDVPDAEALAVIEAGLRPWLDEQASLLEAQLKRWRYALATATHAQRYLLAGALPTLAFAGDAFGGPRIEGAALSGLAAAEAIGKLHTASERVT